MTESDEIELIASALKDKITIRDSDRIALLKEETEAEKPFLPFLKKLGYKVEKISYGAGHSTYNLRKGTVYSSKRIEVSPFLHEIGLGKISIKVSEEKDFRNSLKIASYLADQGFECVVVKDFMS